MNDHGLSTVMSSIVTVNFNPPLFLSFHISCPIIIYLVLHFKIIVHLMQITNNFKPFNFEGLGETESNGSKPLEHQ